MKQYKDIKKVLDELGYIEHLKVIVPEFGFSREEYKNNTELAKEIFNKCVTAQKRK